jgi:hypothetical protein
MGMCAVSMDNMEVFMRYLTLAALIAVSLIATAAPVNALPQCIGRTCGEALQRCQNYRQRHNISPSALKCEQSAATCNRTGIWRGNHMPPGLEGGCKVDGN